MVRCEKTEYGYAVELNGGRMQCIMELAYAVASVHVEQIKTSPILAVMRDDPKSASEAIAAAFSFYVEECVQVLMDKEKTQTIVRDLRSEKGGAAQ